MTIRIAVGLESTIDILITFPTLKKLEVLSRDYDGELSSHLRKSYQKIAAGAGGEVPIDGKRKEAKKLLKLARDKGAKIEYALGGNAAQEAATLENFDCDTIFLGGIFPKSLSKLSKRKKQTLKNTNLELAVKFEKYAPASYIIQVKNKNRYILTEGKGRRINQLRTYLKNLPNTIKRSKEKFGKLNALSLVGWQVLFGNELTKDDLKLTIQTIKKIRQRENILLFTDAGGVGGLDKVERERLCKIYALFDILSVNEDEVIQIASSMGETPNSIIQAMVVILKNSPNLSTIWLHTSDFQLTLTSLFQKDLIKIAQDKAALAGLYKVENGEYPNLENISTLKKNRIYSKKGGETITHIKNRYQSESENYRLIATPCYKAEKFFSTVGAGDVSSATYLYTLINEII